MLTRLKWICTHPIPLHAHTHFLSGLRTALILNAGQAIPAPPSVALCVLQELHHACLMDRVDALMRITNISSSELAWRLKLAPRKW